MRIVQSRSTNVYRNLAMEEWLLDHAPELPVLFLCVNEPCVVIGKNQNPWRECRLSQIKEDGVHLARRVSGGGAVYHDLGNLNVGVLVPRTEYHEEMQYELLSKTLEKFGIQSAKLGKNSLAVEGKKFSGQAFCYRKNRVLHHGTLLVDADLARLTRYLGPEIDGIETKAVASVPSDVMNLSEANPMLTIDSLSAELMDTFKEMYGKKRVVPCESERIAPEEELLPMIENHSSNDWKLYHTPKFTFKGAQVEKGRITNQEGTPLFEEWLRFLNL